jgi:signal transduction histidine kinase/ActR/RegA family two-component response regulator
MMKLLSKISIRQKVITVILLVTAASTVGGFLMEILNNNTALKKELRSKTILNAKLISEFASPTLLFDDVKEARVILNNLESIPYIVHATIIDSLGKPVAVFSKHENFKDEAGFSVFRMDSVINGTLYIKVTEPVLSLNEKIGEVRLIASGLTIRNQLASHIKSVGIIILVTLLVALLLASVAERIVTKPILDLAKITRKVHDTGDFSIRAAKSYEDETGLLFDSFNELMASLGNKQEERDEFENALLEERANLEQRVSQRTAELNLAKEKAEESDRLKSAFLSNMSHEIRTPLNAILGFSDLLIQPEFNDTQKKEFKEIIEINSGDLIRLVDDILDLSKIEANQLKIKSGSYKVNELCSQIFNTFNHAIEKEYIHHEVKTSLLFPDKETDYLFETDPLRFKQILINILNNSIKFTSKGIIEFGYYPDEKNKNITFYIKDTGIGIPPDKIDRIFERFIKVTDLSRKHYKGTGLGLSIAHKLTTLMNGEIRVESELKKGTVFYVTFPYIEKVVTVKESLKARTMIKQEFLDGKVILIAEDLDWNFRYLEMMLGNFNNAKVLWAKNGREAVEMCREHSEIDLVLMDIQMPEMDGYQATTLIKEFRPELPVIAHTAYAMYEEREMCMSAGCCAYIAKPVRKEELLEEIRMAIQKK